MVTELQHVGAQVGAAREQLRLAGRLEVAREEHAATVGVDAQHERAVVVRGPGARARRPERRDREARELEGPRSRAALAQACAAVARGAPDLPERGVGERAVRDPHLAHREPTQDGRDAAAMIEVAVAHGHEVEAAHAESAQRREDGAAADVAAGRWRAAAVDEHGRPRRLHEHRISLADVEEDDPRRVGGHARGRRDREQRTERQRGPRAPRRRRGAQPQRGEPKRRDEREAAGRRASGGRPDAKRHRLAGRERAVGHERQRAQHGLEGRRRGSARHGRGEESAGQ